jgi:hypothetical protein
MGRGFPFAGGTLALPGEPPSGGYALIRIERPQVQQIASRTVASNPWERGRPARTSGSDAGGTPALPGTGWCYPESLFWSCTRPLAAAPFIDTWSNLTWTCLRLS